MEDRQTKREYAGGASPQYHEPVEDFIFRLTSSALMAVEKGYTDLRMDGGTCDGVSFEGTRPETDKEMGDRIRRQNLAAETQARARRAQYEELKKEFEP